MQTKAHGIGPTRMVATLVGAVCCASIANAQPQNGGLPEPRTQTASCREVAWETGLLERYPRVAEACQEVLVSEGNKWARFEAELVRVDRDGIVTLDIKDRNDNPLERITVRPAASQRVSIDGRRYRFDELDWGQELNLYLPEGMFAFAIEPNVSAPEEFLQLIPMPVQNAARQPNPAPQTGPLLAQVNPRPAQQAPRTLPNTAGPLPLVALAGLISLLGGLALTVRRRGFRPAR